LNPGLAINSMPGVKAQGELARTWRLPKAERRSEVGEGAGSEHGS